jgi:hypothetical protein
VTRRLLAGGRHETVQSLVLLSLRPEHFNLDAKSESLPAPKSDEPPQIGNPGGRGRTPPIYYESTKHTAEVEQAKRRRRVHGTHTQGGKTGGKKGNNEYTAITSRFIRYASINRYHFTESKILRDTQGQRSAGRCAGVASLWKGRSTVNWNKESVMYTVINI